MNSNKSWPGLVFGILLIAAMSSAQSIASSSANAQKTPPAATATLAPVSGGEPHYIHPETPEQRKQRLASWDDPGTNPDPKQVFIRYGKPFHIERFERKWAVFDQPEGWVRPMAPANIPAEIYQVNDEYIWVWFFNSVPTPPEPLPDNQPQPRKYDDAAVAYLKSMRPEFSKLDPPDSDVTVRFEEASDGLPSLGSWRNSMAAADMNGDGFMDLIAPPERGGNGLPTIFLGDGKGHWKVWSGVKWPYELNYGSVVAADFNRDGHMDLAFGVHLNGIHVFLGDGKGNFTDASEGLPNDYPSRRIAVADVNGDGYPDVIAISEGPSAVQTTASYSKLIVFLNGGKRGMHWKAVNVSDLRQQFGGDYLAVGDFNGDGIPDFAGASVYFNGTEILYLSEGAGKWKSTGALSAIPYFSYFYANAAGKFVKGSNRADAIVSYARAWPTDTDPRIVPDPELKRTIGVDRISFQGKVPQRIPLARWEGVAPVMGMAAGDITGDGNLDVVYTQSKPRQIVLLVGDGKGGFRRGTIEGVKLLENPNYDLKLVDVNGDGKLDLVVAYESGTGGMTTFTQRTGSIHVYLNRGTVSAGAK
jgi:FG-GAP-like repeat/FG-GAP repeat